MKPTFTAVRAVMRRRILVNFRVRAEALRAVLPAPFRPKLIDGWGLGGICLIQLEHMRPIFLPAALGVSSENAAHRIAVEWNDGAAVREGVFIPRRDTNSLLNLLAGGRLFPGVHHLARFHNEEREGRFNVSLQSRDHQTKVQVIAHTTSSWPNGSLFSSLEQASAFLKAGCCGWSPCGNGHALEGVELDTDHWEMHSLEMERVESSFFAGTKLFPEGSVEFDSALLMRGIPHTWRVTESPQPCRRRPEVHHHGTRAFFELP